jgi:DNA-binding CsgD family transcriptional regulator
VPRRGQVEAKSERAVKALDLRIKGYTYRQIAKALGCGEKTAYYDVQNALGTLDGVKKEVAEQLREIEVARLDALLKALDKKIRTGSVPAIFAAVKVADRRSKLLGLDSPTRHELTGKDGAPLAAESNDSLRARLHSLLEKLPA